MTDYTPIAIVILFTVVTAVSASRNGVVTILASGISAAGAMGVYFLLADILIHRSPDVSVKQVAGIALGSAAVAYLILRLLGTAVLKKMFNSEGFLHWAADGTAGAFLSLMILPVTVLFVFTCVRVAGTVLELNHIATLSRPEAETAPKLPRYPFAADWRSGVESLPYVAPVLDAIDPFSNRAARNAAGMLLSRTSPLLTTHLERAPGTAAAVEIPALKLMAEQEGVRAAVQAGKGVLLMLRPEVRKLAAEPLPGEVLKGVSWKTALIHFTTELRDRMKPVSEELL